MTAASPVRARPPGRRAQGRPAVDVLVVVVCVGLAVLPVVPVFGARAALLPVVGGLVIGAGLAWLSAWRGWGVLTTAAVTLTAYLLAGGALAAPTTTVGGVVPTLTTLTGLLTGTVTVWKEVLTLDPSLGTTGHVLVAPYLLALVGSSVMLGVARRARPRRRAAWAALVPLVVLVVAVLLGTKESVEPVAAGVVLTVLLASWAAWRRGTLARRRVVSLVTLAAVAVAAGVLVGPQTVEDRPRFVLRDELLPPFDPRDHPSPLSSFRKFVKEWSETELLTVRGLPEGAPVRLATLDAFDGVVWNVAGAEAADGSGRFRRVGESISTPVRGREVTVELEVHQLPMVWLPTVGYAQRFEMLAPDALELAGDLRYNDATGTAVLTDGVPSGTRWRAEVVVPVPPDDDAIGTARPGSVSLPQPQRVPDAVPLFAGELAGTATSPVLIARTLEQGLAQNGWFSHGLVEAGDEPSLSGHGADRITTLLTDELMVGDGEQYASAMALMAREMGLPSRVVLGLVHDEDSTDTDRSDGVTFTGSDVEAWVEVAFEGHGWVPFDPTPPETRTPSDEVPDERSEPEPQVLQPPPPPQDPVTPPDDDTEQPRTQDTQEEIEQTTDWTRYVVLAAVVTVPLLLLLLPFLLVAAAKRRRRRRRRRAAEPVARVVGGWEEVLDQARDLHRPVPPTATRREAAVHMARTFSAPVGRRDRARATTESRSRRAARVGTPVSGLAAGADAVVFGPGEPSREQVEAYWAQVDAALAAMRSSVPRRQRWRSRWSIASLRDRRRPRGGRRPAEPRPGR